jgi:hypothetical protein
MEEASQLGHNYIGTEHLLLGLIKENEGIAAQVLLNLRVKLEDVRSRCWSSSAPTRRAAKTMDAPEIGGAPTASSKSKTPALDTFGRDLTELAREGKLDPVIGREQEIERVIQILSAAPRTTRCCSARPASARPRSSRAWPRTSSRQRVPRSCAQAPSGRARPRDDGRGHQVSRPVRGAHQGGDDRGAQGRTSSSSSTSCTRSSAPAVPRARSTPATCSSRRSRAARCSASAPRPSTSTASTSRRTARWSAASRPSWSSRRARRGGADPEGPARQVRGAPPRDLHRRRARVAVECRDALHQSAASCRTRRST